MSENKKHDLHQWIQSMGIIAAMFGAVYMYLSFQSGQNSIQTKLLAMEQQMKQFEIEKSLYPRFSVDVAMEVTRITSDGPDKFGTHLISLPIEIKNEGDLALTNVNCEVKIYRGIRRDYPSAKEFVVVNNMPSDKNGDIEWGEPVATIQALKDSTVSPKSDNRKPITLTIKCKSGEMVGYCLETKVKYMENEFGRINASMHIIASEVPKK